MKRASKGTWKGRHRLPDAVSLPPPLSLPVFPVIQLTAEVLGVLWIGLHAKLLDTVIMHPTKEPLTVLYVRWDKTASPHDGWQ